TQHPVNTAEGIADVGKFIVETKGTCLICHAIENKPNMRGPIWGSGKDGPPIGSRSATREPGKDSQAYLIEALTAPNAFIVEGYKDPNNPTVSIMPDVTKPPINLKHWEVLAVVAYLQSLGGTISVDPKDVLSEAPELAAGGLPDAPKAVPIPPDLIPSVKRGAAIFLTKGTCIGCHMINGEGSMIGPDLSSIGATQTEDYIRTAILDPNAVVVPGYQPNIMPNIFPQVLSNDDLDDLVEYLKQLKGAPLPELQSAAGNTAALLPPEWSPEAEQWMRQHVPGLSRAVVRRMIETTARRNHRTLITMKEIDDTNRRFSFF
ncbi:MAG: c-type cytochrome, partial [bacterium]